MIRLERVTKMYKTSTRPALDRVSVDIERGEFVFLIGPSGSGKSTFLRLLLREDVPTRGTITVADLDVAKLPRRRVPRLRQRIGCVFQDFRLLPNKTVGGNVAFALEVIGKPPQTVRKIVPEVLELVGLEGKAERMPHELSGGEQQRVAIARAFANRPMVLLADEPTGNLDPDTSQDIMLLLERINRTGTTVLMATHDHSIVDSMRRRVVELSMGKLVRDEVRGVYGVGQIVRTDFVVREVVTGLRRNVTMTVAMVLTTAISLALVGTGLLAVRTIDRTEQLYSDRVEVQVALTADISSADADCSQAVCSGLKATLQNSPLVASVRFESQQQAYERYLQLFKGQSLAEVVRPQSLPATLRVKLNDPEAGAQAVREAMIGQVGVRNVIDQRDVVAKLFDFLSGVRNLTFAVAVVQAIAALLLISNTVQVSAFTRRVEVGVMRLVGATRWYTQFPFLIEAVVTGVVGAVIASLGILVGKFLFIDDLLSGIVSNGVIPPIEVGDVLWVSPILLMIGAGVAAVTGYVTLRLYVRL